VRLAEECRTRRDNIWHLILYNCLTVDST